MGEGRNGWSEPSRAPGGLGLCYTGQNQSLAASRYWPCCCLLVVWGVGPCTLGKYENVRGHSLCVTGHTGMQYYVPGTWCRFCVEFCVSWTGAFDSLSLTMCPHVFCAMGLGYSWHFMSLGLIPCQTRLQQHAGRLIRSNLFCPHSKGDDDFKVMEIPRPPLGQLLSTFCMRNFYLG